MSKRTPLLFVSDVLEAIAKIERYTSGLTYEAFEANDLVVDAVVRNLEVIGEAVKHIPEELRERHTVIDWRRVIGFRNIVVHAYFEVDVEIVWMIATTRLPELRRVMEQMLKELQEES